MAEFILKDWYGKEKTFDHDTIYVRGKDGNLMPFTFGTGNPVLESLEVTENGTYTAPDGVDGFDSVTVNVDPTKITLLSEQEINGFAFDSSFGYALLVNPSPFELAIGKKYTVMWDGTEYSCTAYDGSAALDLDNVVYIGNGSAFDQPSNGEPFAILYVSGVGVVSALSDAAESHRIGIYQKGSGGSSDDVRYVTFMSHDGLIEYGKKAVAVGDDCADPITRGVFATPTRESDAQYNYTFYGWATTPNGGADADALKAVAEDKTVYANFASTVRKYTITFYDDDGTTVLNTLSVAYGSVPSYTPTKSEFDFAGWNPEPVAVTGDASYVASWTEMISFATSTWEKISELSQSGEAEKYFAIGDTRIIPVTYDGKTYNYTAKIVGFDHDDLRDSDGGGKAGISIMFFTTMATAKQMNTTDWSSSNKGNWGTSSLRTFVNNTFVTYLPADLRSVLRYVKKSYRAAGTSTIKQEETRIWIPSMNEVGGTSLASHSLNDKQGTLYEYFTYYGYGYSSDTSTKVVDTGNTVRTQFWLRGGAGEGVTRGTFIDGGTKAYVSNASSTYYLAIGFCI